MSERSDEEPYDENAAPLGAVLQGVLWRQARRVNAPAWTSLRGAQRGMALALIALADAEVPE